MAELVSTIDEVSRNILTLYGYSSGNAHEQKFHNTRIKNGKLFVALKQNGHYLFSPSKFAGYRDNDTTHENDLDNRDGGVTNLRITKLLGAPHQLGKTYDEIDAAFLAYCLEHGIEPSRHQKMRQYWLIDQPVQTRRPRTYLLAWNPKRWSWPSEDLAATASRVEWGEHVTDSWSLGGSSKPKSGDRFFLIKLGDEPRGIFGSGTFVSEPFWAAHYADPTKETTYGKIIYDYLVDGRKTVIVPMSELETGKLASQHWHTQRSGVAIDSEVAEALEAVWALRAGIAAGPTLGEEMVGPAILVEGNKLRIVVNKYERDIGARNRCIAHYGTKCAACETTMSGVYGPIAADFVHVHHLTPLSKIGAKYEVDPVRDLRPVCPNCHAIIHLGNETRTIAEVRRLIAQTKKN